MHCTRNLIHAVWLLLVVSTSSWGDEPRPFHVKGFEKEKIRFLYCSERLETAESVKQIKDAGFNVILKVHWKMWEPDRAQPVAETISLAKAAGLKVFVAAWLPTGISDPAFAEKRPFGFHFPEVNWPTVNLELLVEGSEPIWISAISVHAHADAIYREFEHGLVLANPSPRSYVFDLDQLVPGRRFRRLKATRNQDTKANNGSPVAGRLTLQPQEGLFLVER